MQEYKTKKVFAGGVQIGGGAPVTVQSMLNIPAHDTDGNVKQAKALEKAGCDIIRVSVPDKESVKTLAALKSNISIPVVADIHFDYRLALESVAAGADKIRINPGNIGADDRVKAVANACKAAGVPIRIGVNSGSLEKNILAKYGAPTPDAMVESGLYHISLLEKFDFDDIVLSLKSSNVVTMYNAYVLAAKKCRYPLHLGVTEAGGLRAGTVRSAIGIGSLLMSGIGDTLRVSLTADVEEEVKAGYEILKALDLRHRGVRIISCPTCARRGYNVQQTVEELEKRLAHITKPLTLAVMGCVVNGPGESAHADFGVCGGKGGENMIYVGGKPDHKVKSENIVDELVRLVEAKVS